MEGSADTLVSAQRTRKERIASAGSDPVPPLGVSTILCLGVVVLVAKSRIRRLSKMKAPIEYSPLMVRALNKTSVVPWVGSLSRYG